jgi:hypothetical protein
MDLFRTFAHPFLEATGASVRATIAVFAGSKYVPDEQVLLPVPMVTRQNWGPYNISNDLIIEPPRSDSSFGKLAFFIDVQVSGDLCNTILGKII